MKTINDRPIRVLIFGDVAVPTGFGRIGAAIGKHLVAQGYSVVGACIQYDGLLPPRTEVPFHVGSMQGKPIEEIMKAVGGMWAAVRPDIVLSIQDFPYHIMARELTGIDWSTTAHIVITPVDGVPVYSDWLRHVPNFDGMMTISEFGVEAFRKAGHRVDLCPPGVNTSDFHRLPDDERRKLRQQMGIAPDAFVVGVMAMNQGRKDFPAMVAGFTEAFRDVPKAVLYLDCDKVSHAGWDIPKQLVEASGLDPARVKYREDAARAGLIDLNQRYNLLDLHMVLAHREGFGLPHIEAMATECPTVALNYCSGPEIVGLNERGALIKAIRRNFGTWGGAVDYDADMESLAFELRYLYDHPDERKARGKRAYEYAIARTWENAAVATEAVITRAVNARRDDLARKDARTAQPVQQQTIPAGIPAPVIHINGPIYVKADDPASVAAGIGAAVGQAVQAEPAIKPEAGVHLLEGGNHAEA